MTSLLQKRLKEEGSVAGDIADLFEEISNDKRKAWLDMADSGRRKYEKLAEGTLFFLSSPQEYTPMCNFTMCRFGKHYMHANMHFMMPSQMQAQVHTCTVVCMSAIPSLAQSRFTVLAIRASVPVDANKCPPLCTQPLPGLAFSTHFQWSSLLTVLAIKTAYADSFCVGAEDKKRFEDQLKAHPKLAAMIAAYEEKQQELRTLKKGKGKAQSSKGLKKRRRQEDVDSSDDEV